MSNLLFRYPVVQDKRVYVLKAEHMSKPGLVSMTVPDEALTIREIMIKHVRGMHIAEELRKESVYNLSQDDNDYDHPDHEALARMDLAERSDYLSLLKMDIEQRKADLKAAEKAVKDRAIAEAKASALDRSEGMSDEGDPKEQKKEGAKRVTPKATGGKPGPDSSSGDQD